MNTSSEIRMKAAFALLIFTWQFLLAPELVRGQTNFSNTITPPSVPHVSTLDTASNNGTGTASSYLSQLRSAVQPVKVPPALEIEGQLARLEWTGQYVERYIRVPEGNSGQAKLIKFLIPVYRERGTQRQDSVGAEDKEEN